MGCYKERMLREEDVGKIVERASASVGAPLLSSVAEEGKASMVVGLLIGSLLVANSAPSLAGLFVWECDPNNTEVRRRSPNDACRVIAAVDTDFKVGRRTGNGGQHKERSVRRQITQGGAHH